MLNMVDTNSFLSHNALVVIYFVLSQLFIKTLPSL